MVEGESFGNFLLEFGSVVNVLAKVVLDVLYFGNNSSFALLDVRLDRGNPCGERCDGTFEISALQVVNSGNDILEVTFENGFAVGGSEVVNLVEFGGESFDELGKGLYGRESFEACLFNRAKNELKEVGSDGS